MKIKILDKNYLGGSFKNICDKNDDGQKQDDESEYIQMGARTYNPALGRFMSVDPLFEAFPGQSAYSYAFNSPLSWSDPSGLAPEKERKRDRVL